MALGGGRAVLAMSTLSEWAYCRPRFRDVLVVRASWVVIIYRSCRHTIVFWSFDNRRRGQGHSSFGVGRQLPQSADLLVSPAQKTAAA
jgi:hypothetical protein